MQRTANIYARIEPELKANAEEVLEQLGIPLSSAIGMFLRQVVLHNGIPFEMKLPVKSPLNLDTMSTEELEAELHKGLADFATGRVYDAAQVRAEFQRGLSA
jgi:addiction module RelB/DinJ family antitoxin